MEDIKKAYRKQSLKYHPKNNPNNEDARKKFVEINEAYNALSNELKRQTYDDVFFGQITPVRAHSIFDDFFGNRFMEFPTEDEFFKPIIDRSWRKRLDNMMELENEPDFRGVNEGESVKTSSVYTNKNGVETKKNVTTKKRVKDGKIVE
jgi:DnaJ-class molecular chaperone